MNSGLRLSPENHEFPMGLQTPSMDQKRMPAVQQTCQNRRPLPLSANKMQPAFLLSQRTQYSDFAILMAQRPKEHCGRTNAHALFEQTMDSIFSQHSSTNQIHLFVGALPEEIPMSAKHILSATTLVVMAAFLPASNAAADDSVNCDAYAREAIKDAKEAKARGCGFTDSLWSLDYNGHRNWCKQGTIKMANLTWADRARKQGLQQCKDKSDANFQNHRKKEKGCLAYARKAAKLDEKIRNTCPSNSAWPKQLKAYVDWCMQKGGAQYARIANTKRIGTIAGCQNDVQKAKLAQTKTFPNSGKVSARRKRALPVDVCMRKFNRDKSWFLGLGGGMTDVPFGNDCGKSVATAFCITKGYVEAIEAPIKTYDNGRDMDGMLASTYWIGSKKACHGKCAGFRYIKCKGKL